MPPAAPGDLRSCGTDSQKVAFLAKARRDLPQRRGSRELLTVARKAPSRKVRGFCMGSLLLLDPPDLALQGDSLPRGTQDGIHLIGGLYGKEEVTVQDAVPIQKVGAVGHGER